MNKIETFIATIRGAAVTEDQLSILDKEDSSHNIVGEIFKKGNCGNFAHALVLAFGGTVAKVRGRAHVVACIEGQLYDVDGNVSSVYEVESIVDWSLYSDNYSFKERGPCY